MLKSKWIASVLALALIVSPVQGVTAAEAVTGTETVTGTEAVTDTEAATTSGGNAVTEGTQNTGDNSSDNSGVTSAAVETLDVPTGLCWMAENGRLTAQWDIVPTKTGDPVVYDIEVYREGESETSFKDYGIQRTSYSISQDMLSGGNYQFRVNARYQKDNIGASAFSDLSQVYTVKKIATPTGLKLESYSSQLLAKWNAITDAPSVVYDAELYREGETEPCKKEYGLIDSTWYISMEGLTGGKYRFHVRARQLSGEGSTGYFSDYSEAYELKRLATPTATWGEGWMPVLDDSQNKGQIHYFEASIYKDGVQAGQGAVLGVEKDGIDESLINRVFFWSNMNASGNYQFTLRAYPTKEAREAGVMYSCDSEMSKVQYYNQPANRLNVPTVKPHATLPGVFEISNLEGAIGCRLELYYDRGSNGAEWVKVGTSTQCWDNADFKGRIAYYDFRNMIDESNKNYGLGQYKVQARAISGNIDEVANSDLSYLPDCEPSVISSLPLDMTPVGGSGNTPSKDPVISPAPTVSDEKAAEIKNSLQNIVSNNNNATDAVASIKDSENKEELGAAMQQDSSVAQLMSSIEKDYLKENNITVSKNIATKVNTFMDPNAISVVGAGLNVASGNVALDVSVPNKWVDLGRKYNNYNNLQFEIKLVGDNLAEHGKLAVPVLITMPIPKGLNANNLEIIHCKTDGTYERIAPKNNGNGTISFAVTEFSTFAFVSPAETSSNDSDDSGSAEIVYNVDWNNVQNTVAANKTGTTDITTGNSMQVSGQLLQTLKDTKGVLALHTGNGIAVSICGKDVKKTDKNVAITFAENPNIPASAKSSVLANALYSRSFEMKEKVLYSVKMDIHFNVGKQFAGKYANLYHYDELTGTMKLEGTYRITDTGAAMFLLYHGDEYILTVTEKAPKGVVAGGVSNADYTVAEGDTLWGIAAKNGISLRKILAANPNIKNPDRIHVGQKIVIK